MEYNIPVQKGRFGMKKILKNDDKSYVWTDGEYVYKQPLNLSKTESKELRGKLELGMSLDVEGLVTPVDFTARGWRIDEIVYPFVSGIDFYDLARKRDLPLEDVIAYFESLENVVKTCHNHDIIIPDLENTANQMYDPQTGKIHLVDYDGLQVGSYKSGGIRGFGGIGSFLRAPGTRVLINTPKYYQNGLYTTNLDMLSLDLLFMYFTTGFLFSTDPRLKDNLDGYLDLFGLSHTSAGNKMKDLFNLRCDNSYLEESFGELRNYTLVDSESDGLKEFVKKR